MIVPPPLITSSGVVLVVPWAWVWKFLRFIRENQGNPTKKHQNSKNSRVSVS